MQSCRFAFAVHVMAVLALEKADCCPSSRLAQTVNTNPVVIRRLLIELQEAGLISTLRGPHGGAVLRRKPEKVTLREIHHAPVDLLEIIGAQQTGRARLVDIPNAMLTPDAIVAVAPCALLLPV